ncbi:HAMP domain-containing sensor histidine kinase [Streptomyces sp. TLI_171]|uniref:sensor histidine kinase n=1 Tax=Streptomyces sp. TLI_171 TaxID=1938859 RepID=UPI000C629C0C|nr:HAMP domain-containing sensor histidine kinase [Streptomyces sp. TLI_171]RKE20074.1 signal transduction histidine kinase [Streptomyces sp. TLI_171]
MEHPGRPGRPGRPARRRSVRRQFTALYAGLALASGAAMLAVVSLVTGGAIEAAPGPDNPAADPDAVRRIAELQHQLAEAQHDLTRQLLLGSAVGLAVMAVLSVLIGWYAAGRVLRPVRAMTAATRRITADHLHRRLAVGGPHDELRDLGDTIDELLARLEAAFTAQRRFVADASHELRTPLATMRTAVDVTLAKPGPLPAQARTLADRIRPELDRTDRLLEGLLTLARAQHGVLPGADTVPLDELAAAALADHAEDLAARRLAVTRDRDPGALVHGSRTLLARLVDNLVANAVLHNEPGGWLRVTVRPGGLVVENGGPLLTADQTALLVRPFHRHGAARTGEGTGLGLAIAAAVAEAHGGTLRLDPRPDGGLRVTVGLPPAGGPA